MNGTEKDGHQLSAATLTDQASPNTGHDIIHERNGEGRSSGVGCDINGPRVPNTGHDIIHERNGEGWSSAVGCDINGPSDIISVP